MDSIVELFQINVKGLDEIAELNNKGYKMKIETTESDLFGKDIMIKMFDDQGHKVTFGGTVIKTDVSKSTLEK